LIKEEIDYFFQKRLYFKITVLGGNNNPFYFFNSDLPIDKYVNSDDYLGPFLTPFNDTYVIWPKEKKSTFKLKNSICTKKHYSFDKLEIFGSFKRPKSIKRTGLQVKLKKK
jgi:hypothetical protein